MIINICLSDAIAMGFPSFKSRRIHVVAASHGLTNRSSSLSTHRLLMEVLSGLDPEAVYNLTLQCQVSGTNFCPVQYRVVEIRVS